MKLKVWLQAFRLRTLPLSLACIGMGAFLAADRGAFSPAIFALCCITTILLQILSNLANDFGDSVHGADHSGRQGPARTVQTGAISRGQMKRAIAVLVLLCLASGLWLLWTAFGWNPQAIFFFFLLGVASIAAAVAYTMGRRPYGYAGLGDISVLIFFGWIGVLGSLYLFTRHLSWMDVLPATSCGLFSVGVLNINNMRDIESDRQAGKLSIPVRIGRERAAVYQTLLIAIGLLAAVVFVVLGHPRLWHFLFLLTLPAFAWIARATHRLPPYQLDPYLKKMAFTTLAFVVLFGVGLLVG